MKNVTSYRGLQKNALLEDHAFFFANLPNVISKIVTKAASVTTGAR